MKRQTALALAAVFSLSVAGTALAAPANPFVDVPAKHWAYDSVNKLAQAGVISGYGDGTFKGDKTITRYEMAVIVGKALANSSKADAASKKELEALKAEFGTELSNLGVRMDNVEKKLDNTKFSGNIRARYDSDEVLNAKAMSQKLRTRLMITGHINDEWTYNGRVENTQDLRTGTNDGDTVFNQANVAGKIGDFAVTLGRFDVTPAYGIALDDTVDGVVVSFGNKLKVDVFAGKQKYTDPAGKDSTYIVNMGYALTDKLNAKGAYFNVKPDAGDTVNLYEVGMDYQLAPTINVSGAYLKANTDNANKGYFAQVAYKGATKEVGSFGAWVNYRHLEQYTTLSTTLDQWKVDVDGKGYEVGFNYVPFKNGKWTTTYTDLKDINVSTEKGKYFRTQMEFFF